MSTDPNKTLNLTLDALSPRQSANTLFSEGGAQTREERREAARKPMSTTERARAIQDTIQQARAPAPDRTGTPAERPTHRRAQAAESELSTPEEVDSEPPAIDGMDPGDSAEGDETVPERFEDFVAELELDPDYIGGLQVPIKVNGKTEHITLADAIAGTQFAKANHERSAALQKAERQHQAVVEDQVRQYQRLVSQGKQLHVAAANVLQQEFQSAEVQALRQADPAAYLQYQDHLKSRQDALRTSYQQLVDQETQALAAHAEEARIAGLRQLREAIPDFDTPERKEAIVGTFSEFGASAEEMGSVTDPRIFKLASAYADTKRELDALKAERAKEARIARKHARENNAASPAARRPSGQSAATQRKKIAAAREVIQSKRGYAARKATQAAIFTMLQDGRKKGGRR